MSLCGALIYLIYVINIPNTIPIKLLISAVSFDTFHAPFLLVDFDWYLQMKCQHVMDQTNFLMFLLLPRKIGKEFTWQKECVSLPGWGNTSKCCDCFAKQKANTDVTFSVRSISFRQGICQLSQFTHSVCPCRVRFMVSTIMCQKSVVFCEIHSNEPFPTVLKFLRFSPRKWNAPYIASHLIWNDEYFRCYKL